MHKSSFYKAENRKQLAEKLGVQDISTSTLQTALKKLERHNLITKQADNSLTLNSPLFQHWLVDRLLEN